MFTRPDMGVLQTPNLLLPAVIDDELVNRPAVGAADYDLVTLGVIVVGVHPVAFRNHQWCLVTPVARNFQQSVFSEAIPGFADHPVAVLTVNIIKVIVKHCSYFLILLGSWPLAPDNQENHQFEGKDGQRANNEQHVVRAQADNDPTKQWSKGLPKGRI